MQDILPPKSSELERAVLTVLLNNPGMMAHAEDTLTTDCFYETYHQIIFDYLSEAYANGARSGFVALIQMLVAKGQSKDIQKLASELKNEYASELDFFGNINVLSALGMQRQLLNKSYQVRSCIEKADGMEALTGHVHEMGDIISRQNRQVAGITFADSVNELGDMLNAPRVAGLSGINTGIGIVNRFTDGWQDSDVIIIAGRAGMGKTIAGAHHAYFAAKAGIPTAYVSLEVPKKKMTGRILSSLTNIPFGRINKSNVTPYERDMIMSRSREIEGMPLYYYDYNNSWDINDIAITLRSWKRKYGIGLVIVDYIQLVQDRTIKDSSDSTKVVSRVSVKMKQLQSQLNCPVIELAQINRESEGRGNKRPGLENLKQSGQLEQDASTVIILYREDYYLEKAAQERGETYIPSNNLEYIFAKHREGETGTIALKCKPEFNLIYEEDCF